MSRHPNRPYGPGSHLYGILSAVCDEQALQGLVVPTLADLQHEDALAGRHRARRCLAYLHGFAGLFRVLISQFGTGRLRMRRWGVVLTMGIAGAAALVGLYMPGVRLLPGITVFVAPFLLPAILIPIALRRLGLGKSFRQRFINCALVESTMWGAFILWILFVVAPHPRLSYTSAFFIVLLLGCIVFVSALAATLGAERTRG
jgi:hypothetical protein